MNVSSKERTPCLSEYGGVGGVQGPSVAAEEALEAAGGLGALRVCVASVNELPDALLIAQPDEVQPLRLQQLVLRACMASPPLRFLFIKVPLQQRPGW